MDVSKANDICDMSAGELVAAFATRELSPVEAAVAALDRAERVNPALNSFVSLDHEGAVGAATASERRWRAGEPASPIDGVPTTVKDIVWCQGQDVRYGSLAAEETPTGIDAPSVSRLRTAGAVFIGLTTTPEFGWKAVTDSPKHGATRNPWNRSLTPGGSSGGAAVAAATGAGVLHLGTDGGGSIRIPASFTGTVGHKPTYGRVPAYPLSSFGTVAHIGPITRRVEDAAVMLAAMEGRDARDWTQGVASRNKTSIEPFNWRGKRLGYWKSPCIGSVDETVAEVVDKAVASLEAQGAEVEEFPLPCTDELIEVFYRHWYVGAANRLSSIPPLQHGRMDPGLLDAAAEGRRYSAVDRMAAELQRARFGSAMDMLLERYDLVVSPTVPILPFAAGFDVPPGSGLGSWVEWSSFSFPVNLSQQPACSVPCGWTSDGLPIGVQFIGARDDDSQVLGAAMAYQASCPHLFIGMGRAWTGPGGRGIA